METAEPVGADGMGAKQRLEFERLFMRAIQPELDKSEMMTEEQYALVVDLLRVWPTLAARDKKKQAGVTTHANRHKRTHKCTRYIPRLPPPHSPPLPPPFPSLSQPLLARPAHLHTGSTPPRPQAVLLVPSLTCMRGLGVTSRPRGEEHRVRPGGYSRGGIPIGSIQFHDQHPEGGTGGPAEVAGPGPRHPTV